MRVLMIGFNSYQELDIAINKLMEESQCFLFTVVCGGMDILPFRDKGEYVSLAHEWAEKNGAPINWCCNYYTIDEMIRDLHRNTDYLLIKIDENTPQIWKNFMMAHKAEGKHGTVVR